MKWKDLFDMEYPHGELDILSIGETVIDLISVEETTDLYNATNFERFQGGSPANIALNIARLGGKSAVVSIIGKDGFGRFIHQSLQSAGVDVRYLYEDERFPTTVNIISRTPGTADSIHLRFADYQLSTAHINTEMIQKSKIVHASAFALSCEPSRSAIEKAFLLARCHNKLVSLDPNFNQLDWGNNIDARKLLLPFFQYVNITKPSFDDAVRLFGGGYTPQEYIHKYHEMGPRVVILTMGSKGSILSFDGQQIHVPAKKMNVIDATGAGDAFWAGFLTALLDEKSILECALVGQYVVETYLSAIGPIRNVLDRDAIYTASERELQNYPPLIQHREI